MSDTQAPTQGPELPRNPRYQQQIIRFDGTPIYLRVDTGPNLESVLLCYEDGEPDTNDIGRLYGLKTADMFVALMELAGHKRRAQ